jgi:hypothetical protein
MKFLLYIVVIALMLLSVMGQVDITTRAREAKIPTVGHCSLISNVALYDGKEVRVHGIYMVAGTSVSTFFSSSCQDGKKVWVEFNPEYQSCSKAKLVKVLAEMKRKSGFRWARPHVSVVTGEYRSAEVEFVGTFLNTNPYKPQSKPETDGPLSPLLTNRQSADFVFKVSCVEKVKPLTRNAKY